MTAHEIRPKQLRALLLLLVLVPLIPLSLMVRFMSDALKGERMDAIEHTQQFQAELLASALRSAPPLEGTPAERAARLLAHLQEFAERSVAIRIVDGTGRLLAGEESPKGQPLAQERAPAGLEGLVQLYLARPEVIDEAVSGQQRIYIATGAITTLAVLLIAGTAAMAVSRQLTLQELKNTSVAIVAHELRTPLASMRMLVDTLREGRYRNEQQLREYLELIASEGDRLRRIAESFLSFSRLERGMQPLDLGPIAPHAVAAQAVAPFTARLAAPGCTFAMEVPESLAPVRADREALAQVLANLIDNALKYTGEEKRIALRARVNGTILAFTVEDNGIGIAPDQRREIFEPFHQVDQRLSRTREGAGLGLAIVRRIVKAHGGEITVAGEPGKGSVFTVKIPLAWNTTTTVLIVEDDPAMLRGLKDNFEFEGYKVITATDGDAGIKAALDGQPDLIVLDVMLPKVNGYEVCRFIRSEKLAMPILMLTAKGHESDIVLGLKLGADDYVTKPFSIKELLARAEVLLRSQKRGSTAEIYTFGDCTLDCDARTFTRSGKSCRCSPKEFELLRFLASRPGQALSRDLIMNTVWGYDAAVTPRSIDRFVNALRNKIEKDPAKPHHIRTVREFGYKFEP